MCKYYLYRHIREDKNEPFYIGIATKGKEPFHTYRQEYSRAFVKNRRSDFWKKIINKTGYTVEIIFETDNVEEAKQKEIEFIKLYGRKDLGTGTLVNLTDGGYGNPNYTTPTISVYVYDRSGEYLTEFENTKIAEKELGIKESTIKTGILTKCTVNKKYKFSREKIEKVVRESKTSNERKGKWKPVIIFDSSFNIIKECESGKEAALYIGTATSKITRSCKTGIKIKNFRVCYKNDFNYSEKIPNYQTESTYFKNRVLKINE